MSLRLPINFISLIIFCCTHVQAQVGPLVWQDDFNNQSLDTAYWNIETGTGVNGDWGTGQLDRARAENLSFMDSIPGADNDCLAITTKKEWYVDRYYTSGRINTAGKVSWGPGHRIMAKVFPRDVKEKGQGFAFWMMPDEIPAGWSYIMWPQGGEIDIMEYVGAIPYHNLGSVHYAWYWENNQWQSWNHGHQGAYYSYEDEQVPNPIAPGYGNYPPPDTAIYAGRYQFHTYGIDWYQDRIEFFVDSTVYHIHYLEDGGGFQVDGQDQFAVSSSSGKRVATSEYSHHFTEWYPYEHNMYVILSAGVGGSDTYTYGGAITSSAVFPCTVLIDWVKVHELLGMGIDEGQRPKVSIYPNPSTDFIYVDWPNGQPLRWCLFDLNGKVVRKGVRATTISTEGIAAGKYLLVVEDEELRVSKSVILN